jgi:predicted permease
MFTHCSCITYFRNLFIIIYTHSRKGYLPTRTLSLHFGGVILVIIFIDIDTACVSLHISYLLQAASFVMSHILYGCDLHAYLI